MKVTRRIPTMLKLILASALFCLPLFGGQQDNRKIEGSTKDIDWGTTWAGPKLKGPADIKGKVTLLVIWGG